VQSWNWNVARGIKKKRRECESWSLGEGSAGALEGSRTFPRVPLSSLRFASLRLGQRVSGQVSCVACQSVRGTGLVCICSDGAP
jgi:hypothetical protein